MLDETFVTGDVDDAHLTTGGEFEPGKTQFDGHAPLLFLPEAVGVNTGQSLHQQRLAVVDVSGGSQYVHDEPYFFCLSKPATSRSD